MPVMGRGSVYDGGLPMMGGGGGLPMMGLGICL